MGTRPRGRMGTPAGVGVADVWLVGVGDGDTGPVDRTFREVVAQLRALGFGGARRFANALEAERALEKGARPEAAPAVPRWVVAVLLATDAVADHGPGHVADLGADPNPRVGHGGLEHLMKRLREAREATRREPPGHEPIALVLVATGTLAPADEVFSAASALLADEVFAFDVGPAEIAFRLRRVALVKQLYYRELALGHRVAALREATAAAESGLARLAEVERANRAKDELLATVSHELRTPLNAIVGWSDLLRADTSDQLDRRQALDTIARNARVQARMIEDILDLSRSMSGRLRVELQRVDLRVLATQAVDALRVAAAAKRLLVGVVVPDEAVWVEADPDRLTQVITNLVGNAIKFTPPRGSIELAVNRERTAKTTSLSVRDTGAGIREEFLPFVFERFRQADGHGGKRADGLGLGLAIVRHLVELHGGRVTAASDGQGRGATFVVALPTVD